MSSQCAISQSDTVQRAIVQFLSEPESYPGDVEQVTHIETHISHIFLAGEFAYKLKKALKLPFLDFSAEASRSHFVREELRLNKRYAPEIYLEVLGLTVDTDQNVSWCDPQQASELLLKMKRFPEGALFSDLLKSGSLTEDNVITLADKIAQFHLQAEPMPGYFDPKTVKELIFDCFEVLDPKLVSQNVVAQVQKVLEEKGPFITSRQKTHVKFLHGDLHLKNICLFNGEPYLFDGIEFSKKYSCVDTIADLAFLLMDFWYEKAGELAWLVLNRYLERTFDYEGISLLPIFLLYRALVRAKVAYLRYQQLGEERDLNSVKQHLKLGEDFLSERSPQLIVVGGLSGSGKSWTARRLAAACGMFHVRTDVVRKHLMSIPLEENLPQESYSREQSELVYEKAYEIALSLIDRGYKVIVDGVHGDDFSRRRVLQATSSTGIRSLCYWCEVSDETARKRLTSRAGDPSDAGIEVYEKQKERFVTPDEPWRKISTEDSTVMSHLVGEVQNDRERESIF